MLLIGCLVVDIGIHERLRDLSEGLCRGNCVIYRKVLGLKDGLSRDSFWALTA
jgi:hypothetical protein